jgi:hypothetical protein
VRGFLIAISETRDTARRLLREEGMKRTSDVPAEHVITPFFFSASERCAIMLYAPRILNEKTGCKSSRLSQIWTRVNNATTRSEVSLR